MGRLNKWGWMVMKSGPITKTDDGKVSFHIHLTIRYWHPGYWLFYWRTAFTFANELGTPFHKWFPLALYRFLLFREDENKAQ
jgi:hypothetical protein